MKKCFIVTVELEEAVWAETPEEAKQIARKERAFNEGLSGCTEGDMDAAPATHYPAGYEDDSYVYGASGENDPDTLKEALEQTPEYQAANERLQKLVEAHKK